MVRLTLSLLSKFSTVPGQRGLSGCPGLTGVFGCGVGLSGLTGSTYSTVRRWDDEIEFERITDFCPTLFCLLVFIAFR